MVKKTTAFRDFWFFVWCADCMTFNVLIKSYVLMINKTVKPGDSGDSYSNEVGHVT